MEEFLNDYVQMMLDAQEIELPEEKVDKIVHNMMECDEAWDVFDSYINDFIKFIKIEKEEK